MKQLIAIVKPFLAEKVIQEIAEEEVQDICIRQVKGFGRQKNYLDQYGDNEYSLAYVPKVEIHVWVDDENLESVITRIETVSRTGRMGDGKIFVLPTGSMVEF